MLRRLRQPHQSCFYPADGTLRVTLDDGERAAIDVGQRQKRARLVIVAALQRLDRALKQAFRLRDAPNLDDMRWRIIRRYYTDEAATQRYAESTRDQPNVLLVVTPARILSQDFN
ncbi:MAG: hypothetical protein ACP5J4_16970 [Anaerolineae bacterium]